MSDQWRSLRRRLLAAGVIVVVGGSVALPSLRDAYVTVPLWIALTTIASLGVLASVIGMLAVDGVLRVVGRGAYFFPRSLDRETTPSRWKGSVGVVASSLAAAAYSAHLERLYPVAPWWMNLGSTGLVLGAWLVIARLVASGSRRLIDRKRAENASS